MYAITPRGVGNPVVWRAVRAGWPLAEGETFITSEDPAGKVLAEDEQSLRDYTAAEVLANAKADKRAALAARRYEAETGGITVNGVPIKTDRETQMILSAARTVALEDNTFTVDWKVGSGVFTTLDAATVIAVANAVRVHVQNCFSNEKTIDALIEAAADVAAVRAIDLNSGW